MSDTRVFIQHIGGEWVAKQPDGWVLAGCSLVGRVVNGTHDGTEIGKYFFNLLATALLDGGEPPSIVEYTKKGTPT